MPPKRLQSKQNDKQRKKKFISVSDKLKVLDIIESGTSIAETSRQVNLAHSTVRTILKNKQKIRETAVNISSRVADKVSVTRNPLLLTMENLLYTWVQDQRQKGCPLSTELITSKASSLYEDIKIRDNQVGVHHKFSASIGWFRGFKKRFNIANVRLHGEGASCDTDAVPSFLSKFKEIISENSYLPQQVYNVDETGLFWKRMPSRTYVTESERRASGFKAHKDRLTLLLGGNASGDAKLPPLLVYRSENPRALKNINKSELPVIWKSNKKAWITKSLFTDWFTSSFVPFVIKFNEENNLENKALLVLDNAPGHPLNLEELYPNIKVLFLPPNTTPILQPMDQGVIAAFKAYYLRKTMKKLVSATSGETEDVLSFWKSLNIKDGIDVIDCAWKEVTALTMNSVWKKIWPEVSANDKEIPNIELCTEETKELFHAAGFKDIVIGDISDLLLAHDEELTNDELLQLEDQSFADDLHLLDCTSESEKKAQEKRAEIMNNFLDAGNHFKELMSTVEEDEDKAECNKQTIDAIINYYKKKLSK